MLSKMRNTCLLSTAATLSFLAATSATLTEITGITASANGWDTRTNGAGCAPSGCVADNVLDDSMADASRWSCSASLSGVDMCELTLDFDMAQDIAKMEMALYKGDERSRSVEVWVDGVYVRTITSSGATADYEAYELVASQASTVLLRASDIAGNGWISITEVKFFTKEGLHAPTPSPTGDSSSELTEITGITASANGWDTRVDRSGCPPIGCVAENVLDDSLADVSRWSCNAVWSDIDVCELTLEWDTLEDLAQLQVAFYKGDERTRSIDVWVDGALDRTITSSGTTTDYEEFTLNSSQATSVVLRAASNDGNGWLSITEVKLFAGDVTVPAPTPSPTKAPAMAPYATTTTTVTTSTSECPSGSTPNSLDITLEYVEGDVALWLYVEEPGGEVLSLQNRLGDVGIVTNYDEGITFNSPIVHNYLLLNGLSEGEDQVLGDYTVYGRTLSAADDSEPIPWVMTARSNGQLLWTEEGLSPARGEATEFSYIATVTEYVQSDCSLERYDECAPDTFGASGTPPCEACPSDLSADFGAEYCTVAALDSLDLPEVINDAILADAPYGFAGYGYVDNREQEIISLDAEAENALEITGTVILFDDSRELPESIALYYYAYDDLAASVTDYTTGTGDVDPSTGEYSVSLEVPDGKSRIILSFVVLDEADTLSGSTAIEQQTVFAFEVLSNDCDEHYLTFTLEWDTDGTNIDMYVTEPGGLEIYGGSRGDVGWIDVDDMDGFGPEVYRLFNGLSVDSSEVLGDYGAMIWYGSVDVDTTWNLTARIAGEVVLQEQGFFAGDPDLVDDFTSELFVVTLEDYVSYDNC